MSILNPQAGQLAPWAINFTQFTTAMPWVKPVDDEHLIPLTINSLTDKNLQFVQLEGREDLSNLYQWTLTFDYPDATLAGKDVARQQVAINYAMESVKDSSQTFQRVFTGHIWDLKKPRQWYLANDGQTKMYRYQATIVPKLYCLNHHIDNRIYVDKTAKDIITAIFTEHGFDASKDYNFDGLDGEGLASSYKIPVCAQYQESDWMFIQRLLMKMGVYFYFEHAISDSGDITHKAHFSDKKPGGVVTAPAQAALSKPYYFGAYQPLIGGEEQFWIGLSNLTAAEHSMLAAVAVDGYSYENPAQSLLAQQDVKPSGVKISSHPSFGHYYSQQGHDTTDDGKALAQVRGSQYEALQNQISVHSNLPAYGLMQKFTIADSQNFKDNAWGYSAGDYYVYQTQFNISLLAAAGSNIAPPMFIMQCLPLASDAVAPCPYYSLPASPATQTKLTAVVVNSEGKYDSDTIKNANTALTPDTFRNVYIAFTWDQQVRTNKQQALTPVPSHYYAPPGMAAAPLIGSNVLVEFAQFDDVPNIIGAQFSKNYQPYQANDPSYETVFMRQTVDASQLNLINQIIFSDQVDPDMKKQLLSIVAPGAFSLTAANGNNEENQAVFNMGADGTITLGNPKASITIKPTGDIEIANQAGVKLVLDSAGKLTVNAKSDISLDSNANITLGADDGIDLSADADIVVNADEAVQITANGSLQLSGLTTTVQAKTALTNKAPAISSGP